MAALPHRPPSALLTERRGPPCRLQPEGSTRLRHHPDPDAARRPHSWSTMIDIELGPALLAGFIAGLLMEGPVYLQKALGLPVKQNIFRTWGLLFGQRGTTGYVVGILFHQVVALFAAVLYAVFFRAIGVDSDLWLWGLIGGLVHWTIAGPVVKALPSVDPDTGEVGKQGLAYKDYGTLDVVTSLVGHLGFGTATGILYGYLHSGGGSGLAF